MIRRRLNRSSDEAEPVRRRLKVKSSREDEGGLTVRQRRFVAELLSDPAANQTQAAIRAGYSPKSARIAGSINMKDPNIAKAIREAQTERLRRCDITADKVIEELAAVGFSKTSPALPKPSDKISALTALARYLGLMTDKVEVNSKLLAVHVTKDDLDATRRLLQSTFSEPPLIEHEGE